MACRWLCDDRMLCTHQICKGQIGPWPTCGNTHPSKQVLSWRDRPRFIAMAAMCRRSSLTCTHGLGLSHGFSVRIAASIFASPPWLGRTLTTWLCLECLQVTVCDLCGLDVVAPPTVAGSRLMPRCRRRHLTSEVGNYYGLLNFHSRVLKFPVKHIFKLGVWLVLKSVVKVISGWR